LLNALYFKHYFDIYFEFIPRIIFLWAIFGYLSFMIIFKWCIDYQGQDQYNCQVMQHFNLSCTTDSIQLIPNGTFHYGGSYNAPVLLNELIFMILPAPSGQENNLYAGQHSLQTAFIVIAILMIPLMMCFKPCCLREQHKKNPKHTIVHHADDEESESEPILTDDIPEGNGGHGGHGHGGHGHGEFQFSEAVVHQALETIEFVLGSVSHTASYLRLWALSLAHSELSTVFWGKIITYVGFMFPDSFGMTAILMFVGYSVWFFITILVMMFMEGLSAFLHALRLHWVEFQSKFYRGDGHLFQPFSYARVNDPNDSEFN